MQNKLQKFFKYSHNVDLLCKKMPNGIRVLFFFKKTFISSIFVPKNIYLYLNVGKRVIFFRTKFKNLKYFNTVVSQVGIILDDLFCVFLLPVKLDGFGMRLVEVSNQGFIFDLAKSHLTTVQCPPGVFLTQLSKDGSEFFWGGLNRNLVLNFSMQFLKLKPINLYTGKGINLGRPLILKKRKKK